MLFVHSNTFLLYCFFESLDKIMKPGTNTNYAKHGMCNKIIAYSYFSYQFEKLADFIILLNIPCLVFTNTMLE